MLQVTIPSLSAFADWSKISPHASHDSSVNVPSVPPICPIWKGWFWGITKQLLPTKNTESWASQSISYSYRRFFGRQCLMALLQYRESTKKSGKSSLWSKQELKTSRTAQSADETSRSGREGGIPHRRVAQTQGEQNWTCCDILGKTFHLPGFAKWDTEVSDF